MKSKSRAKTAAADPTDEAAPGFYCEVVAGERIEEAIAIRRRAYVEEFGKLVGACERDAFDDRALQLVARDSMGEPAGALRLLDESARPFEVESFLDLAGLLSPDRHFAEITRLCILRKHRRIVNSGAVHFAIFAAAIRVARERNVTDIIASTRTDVAPIYRYLLFELEKDFVYYHPHINNAQHIVIHLDLQTIHERYKSLRPDLYKLLDN